MPLFHTFHHLPSQTHLRAAASIEPIPNTEIRLFLLMCSARGQKGSRLQGAFHSYLLGSVVVEGAVATEVLDVAGADGCLHIREVEEAEGQLDVESQAATPEGRITARLKRGVWNPPRPAMRGDFGSPSNSQKSLGRVGGHSPVIDKEVVLVPPQDLPDVGVPVLGLQDGHAGRGLPAQLREHGAGQRRLLVDDHEADVGRALPGQPLPQAPEAAGRSRWRGCRAWGCRSALRRRGLL